jgi:hypothetical protein
MAVQYANGKIVTSGLVLALDAADKNSYPGSGTTWTDLSGNNNSGSLVNGPTYSSANGGSVVFNGSTQYAPIGTTGFPFGTSPGTLSGWANTNTTSGLHWIVSYGTGDTAQSRFLGIINSVYYFGGYNGVDITYNAVVSNVWFNMVGIYDGTNASMYINGVLVVGPTARSWNTVAGNAQIGRQTNNTEYWSGNIGQISIYNRVLSASEILQNYNAQKSRFGLK